MIRYCWRIGSVEWRIPAESREEAERLLRFLLGVEKGYNLPAMSHQMPFKETKVAKVD